MDSFHHYHHQQDRRILGPPMGGVGGVDDHHHQWYPSSSPQPPPPPSGYYNHLPPPHQPPQQHFYHRHSPYPPPPHHNQFRPHRPMPMPHRQPLPPPSAYPPPHTPSQLQSWENTSWPQHQGWQYPKRNIPYYTEEDWASKAKAWASEKAGPENHHAQSHFTSVSRVDEHNYTYHDQYQQTIGPTCVVQQASFPQSSNQQLQVGTFSPLKQVNHLNGSASFSFGSSSYGTGYTSGVETRRTNADHMAPPPTNYNPSLCIYEQEVSYNYSSAPGNRESLHQSEGSHVPLPLTVSSVSEGQHSQSTLPIQMTSADQTHFIHHGQHTNFLPDVCNQPLDFQGRHDSDRESHPKINYGLAGSAGAVGMMDHDPAASTVHTWTPTAPAVGSPQIPFSPAARTQFDPTFISQASLPVQPSPSFGGIPAPSFQPVGVPYGVGPGASLHSDFNGDPNGAVIPSELPKKAAVPNWLREEIVKKKSIIPSAVSAQPTGNSFDSFGSEVVDKSLRRADQGDSMSMDSTRSTEDEEDDEEDVEAARLAAINQEIKRVLTDVLLKVTDELFDEIATKVLNEDDLSVEAMEENVIDGNQVVLPSMGIPTPKAVAKVLVSVRTETNKVDGAGENSSTSSPGGNILGLANYDSGNDDDEIQSSKASSGNEVHASHQHESKDKPCENDIPSVKDESDINGVAQRRRTRGSPPVNKLRYPDKEGEGDSVICEEQVSVDSGKLIELPSETIISCQSNVTLGEKDDKGQESMIGRAKSDKLHSKDYQGTELTRDMRLNKNPQNRGDNKAIVEKISCKTSDARDSIIHEDKLREKIEKRDKFIESAHDKISKRGSKLKESDSRRSSMDGIRDDEKETTKDKRDKYKEDSERRREQVGDEKEDRTTCATGDSSRYNSRRSPSPSSRGKNSKDNSFSCSNVLGDEPSDNSNKRKKQLYNSSLLPSPPKSRKRQDSRSPCSKHAHHRHSPYHSSEKRRMSRSISPVHRRSDAHKRRS